MGAVFEGENEEVERMVEFVDRGSSRARVSNVQVLWEEYQGELEEFRVQNRG